MEFEVEKNAKITVFINTKMLKSERAKNECV